MTMQPDSNRVADTRQSSAGAVHDRPLACRSAGRDQPELDYAGLFDASPNPYLVLDRKLNIVGANRAYPQSRVATCQA